MYIDDINNIWDESINNYFTIWIIQKTKELINIDTLLNETNFVKFQKEINKTFDLSFSIISQDKIKSIVTKNSNIDLINNIIKKYICYYFFTFLGVVYKDKFDLFNNNLIEFSRNQANYEIKVDNFFSSESNSNIVKIVLLIKELIDLIEKIYNQSKKEKNKSKLSRSINTEEKNNDLKIKKVDENEKELISEEVNSDLTKYTTILKNYSKELNNFLLKNDLIDTLLELYEKNIIEKKDDISKNVYLHVVIKTIIYLKLYNEEKRDIFNIIENSEISTGEYVYIDVVVPQSVYVDYDVIENILNPQELKTDYPEKIYKLLNEDYSENLNDKRKYYSNLEIKIQKLLDTKLLIPIVDDFLIFHKNNEKYEKQTDKIEAPKKKEETKIKYIINKINTYSEYYRNPTEIKKLQFVPLQDRNAITVNVYEDIKIISKMINIIKMNIENLDLFNDLINYREYPYISFKDFEKNGFIYNDENTNIALRNINFTNLKKNKIQSLQTRTITTEYPLILLVLLL